MNKSIKKILRFIPELNREPFFILEGNGRIIFTNKQGRKLLNITETSSFITDYFEVETKEKFDELLDTVVDLHETVTKDSMQLKLINGEKINAHITIKIFEYERNIFLFCTIISKKYITNLKKINRLDLLEHDKQKVIRNKDILEIVTKVETLYPLTFIVKETIQNLSNKIEEFFWITDSNGKFILVNDYFAKSMKLKSFQMEGKKSDMFVPGYLRDLNFQIEKFLRQTLSCVVLDGFQFGEQRDLEGREIIQLPVFDERNNFQAVIGFSQPKDHHYKAIQEEELYDDLYSVLRFFPKPIAFITSEGTIKQTSGEFCKLLERKSDELDGLNFAEILPGSLAESLKRFDKSADNQRILPLNQQLEIENRGEPEHTVYLTKFFRAQNQIKGFSILIEKVEYADNFQHLIRSKGRMFEFLIENNPQPIYIYDKENLKFVEANQSALDLYGYSKDEFLEMDLTDLYNPEDIQTLISSSSKNEVEGKFSKPLRQKRKDGTSILVEISKINFKFNERDAYFNIIRDVTENQELEKRDQIFKATFEHTNDLIIVTDPEGIIKYVNSAASDIIGLPQNELEKSSMASIVVDEDRTIINTSVFQSHLKEPVELNIGLKSSAGEQLDFEISATPILNFESEVESYIIIGKTTKALPTQVEGEEEILEMPPEAASTSSQFESVFLSGVFHEILTPMNVILGFSQELTEGAENLNPDQQEAVEIINQNRSELLNIMNSIIEFSEIERKKDEWNLSNISITDVVEELNNEIFEITGSKNIEFAFGKISSSLTFTTDKQKFDCLLHNLIRLISKLCKEHKIYFSAVPVGDNDFIIRISDAYSGITDHLLDTLNKIFLQSYDPKELGVSKLGSQITILLLGLLQGKFVSSTDKAGKHESGFRFPIMIDTSSLEVVEKLSEETTVEPVAEVQEEQQQPETTEKPPEEPQAETTEEAVVEDQQPEPSEETVADEFASDEDHGIEIEEETEIPDIPEPFPPVKSEKPVEEEKIEDESELPKPPPDEVQEIKEVPAAGNKVEEHSFSLQEDKLDLSNLTCLYIEDQVDSQILFRVQMRGLKDIKYAASFEDSLPLLESEHFDFIVMDINLQGEYNGLDALKIIHKMQGYEDMPIIAVTAYVLPGDKEKFIATGFSDFIAKPIFREKMVESLEKIFLQKA
ncbi:MAG: PAS domain S-box protein [Ignavibacterium sp.]|nr:MAG: PAS domain S-box protein [Ignavibacterium sp.]